MRRSSTWLALALLVSASSFAGGAAGPDTVSIFLIDQESRLRLLPGSTRFEESVLRQENLTERAALRRYPSGPTNTCLARAFETLKALCGAEPAPLEIAGNEGDGGAKGSVKEIELPSTFKRPEPPSAEDEAARRRDALPAPKPPPRSLRCPLGAFRGELGDALATRASDSGVQSLYFSLLLTSKLPPSRADKREYWRLHGRRSDYQEDTQARAGAADTRSGRELETPLDQRHDLEINDFERQIPDFDNSPPLLRLQLRGESPDGHVELLAGRLLAKLPRGEDDAFDAPARCSVSASMILAMLNR